MGYPASVDTGQVAPWLIEAGDAGSASTGVLAANTTYLIGFSINGELTINAVRYRATIASGNLDVGIYDASGNLLGHSGSTAVVAAVTALSLSSPLPVSRGRYYMALWIDNATASFERLNTSSANFSNSAISTGTNTGGLASTFAGMGGVTQPTAFKVMLEALIAGGFV